MEMTKKEFNKQQKAKMKEIKKFNAKMYKKYNKEKKMNLMIAQGVTTIIDGNTELEKLATYDFNATPANPVVDYKVF